MNVCVCVFMSVCVCLLKRVFVTRSEKKCEIICDCHFNSKFINYSERAAVVERENMILLTKMRTIMSEQDVDKYHNTESEIYGGSLNENSRLREKERIATKNAVKKPFYLRSFKDLLIHFSSFIVLHLVIHLVIYYYL